MTLENGQVGSFKILEKIGEGGMAVIYKATQPSLNRNVVIKKLKDPNREIIARFKKEALVSASFAQENVLAIYDFIYEGRSYYLVMEHVDGEDLRTIIDYSAPLPAHIAALIIQDVARGLEYTHSKNVIHRDIKPSNVLLSYQGEVKLIDFGVAKDEKPSKLTVTGMIVGTPSYMSPEQANGDPLGKQSDIYSLGVLLYEMVTGTKPFPGETNTEILMKIVKGKYPSPRKYNHELPHGLVRIIRKAMRRDAARRYQNASELIRDLSRFIPWQKQIHRKELIARFLTRFKREARTQTTSQMYPPVAFNTHPRSLVGFLIILLLLTIQGGYQMWRFLVNERFGRIDLTTNLENSLLVLNDQKGIPLKGRSGVIPHLTPGKYTIAVLGKAGKGVYETNVRLQPGQDIRINALLPSPDSRAHLKITSEPDGARVFDRERYLGETPLDSLELEQGNHLLRIIGENTRPFERRLQLERGQSYTFHFNLEPDK